MKYHVTYAVDARLTVEVEAGSVEEAKKKAADEYMEADLGALEAVDEAVDHVEDDEGNFLD